MRRELLRLRRSMGSNFIWPYLHGTSVARYKRFPLSVGRDVDKFFLGCILNYQMKIDTVWRKAGRFGDKVPITETIWEFITSRYTKEEWAKQFENKRMRLHRFPAGHMRAWKIGKRIMDQYGGVAIEIWADTQDLDVVLDRFLKLGVGKNLSNMTVGALMDNGYIKGSGNIKVDSNIRRVVKRVAGNPKMTDDQVMKFVADIYPKNPWDLDRPLFLIGLEYCRPKQTSCSHCPIRNYCLFTDRNLKRK